MSILQQFCQFEDQQSLVVRLVPYKPKPSLGLEGEREFDRELIRRARVGGSVIRSNRHYERLLAKLSLWGYSVQTPADWEFSR